MLIMILQVPTTRVSRRFLAPVSTQMRATQAKMVLTNMFQSDWFTRATPGVG